MRTREEELDEEMYYYLCCFIGSSFDSANGRKKLLECISDWRVSISLNKTRLLFRVDAGAILDRISTFASSCFTFEQENLLLSLLLPPPQLHHDNDNNNSNHCSNDHNNNNDYYYGVISIDMESIPEVARYKQGFTVLKPEKKIGMKKYYYYYYYYIVK